MKKLCRENVYSFSENKGWEKVWDSWWLKYRDMDNLPAKRENIFYDFDSAYTYLSNNRMHSAYAWKTKIFKKPRISYCHHGLFVDKPEVMTKKNFKPFGEKYVWEEDTGRYTIKELSNELLADDFIEYCKDHGMPFYTLNKNSLWEDEKWIQFFCVKDAENN